MNVTNIAGKRFNHLVAIKYDHSVRMPGGQISHYWLFKCDCGKEKVMKKCNVVSGHCKTCGCGNHLKKHGLSYTRIYGLWLCIKDRCFNPNTPAYKWYGGRGVLMCDLWKNNFKSFYDWAINNGYKKGLSIDRIDNDKGYCPENCRWVTQKEQCRNTSRTKMITYKGETLCFKDMTRKYGIPWATAWYRLKKGKPLDEVFAKVKKCL